MSLAHPRTTLRVAEVMTRDPLTVSVYDTVRHTASLLLDAAIRHLPVVEGDKLVGIISDRDIRNVIPLNVLHAGFDDDARAALARPVSTVMSRELLSVTPETPLVDAIDLLLRGKVSALPVVEASTERLVGIVTTTDALRAARDCLNPQPASHWPTEPRDCG